MDDLNLVLKETIFNNGMLYFNALLSDIQQSCQSIDMAAYIFDDDMIGEKVLASLCAAASRGVQIRLMVDGNGTPNWSAKYAIQLEKYGIQTRVYHPFPWRFWDWKRAVVKKPRLTQWLYLLANINKRDHRKMAIIDQRIVFVGSCNISKKHVPVDYGGMGWHDIAVRLDLSDVKPLQKAFDYSFTHYPIKDRIQQSVGEVSTASVFRLNYSRHQRRSLYKNLLKKIMKAKERIWLTNAYFLPDNFLLKTLKIAAARGVDVKILLPKKSDVFIMPWASETFYRSLIESGVEIYEYLPSVLHAKILIIDDWVSIGSSNLNHRSLLHDLEVDVSLQTHQAKAQVCEQFCEDMKKSDQVSLCDWSQRPWHRRFLGQLVLYVKYVL